MTMEFFFPEDNPNLTPPEETRIIAISASPYPDGRRLRVNIEMTPFRKRPHLEVILTNGAGEEVASASVVEPLTWRIEFTMHLRGELSNPYTISAALFYPDGPSNDPQAFTFDVTPPPPAAEPAPKA